MQLYSLKSEYFDEIAQYGDGTGPVAVGGEVNVASLLHAYSLGVFPWNNEQEPISWYSPDPRMVLDPFQAVFSKSLLKTIKKMEFQVKFDSDFESVITHCADVLRNGESGSWITNDVKNTFIQLYELGLAHSVEAYFEDNLAGGLYGLSIGKLFFGESMFYLHPNASKTAFYYLVRFLQSHNFDLIDAQQETPYLASFGAKPITRSKFMEIVKESVQKPTLIGNWNDTCIEKRIIEVV